MIKVFAIEPEAILNPRIQQALEDFGFPKGRIVGCVPKDWRKLILELYNHQPEGPEKIALSRFLDRLWRHGALQRIRLDSIHSNDWLRKATAVALHDLDGIVVREEITENADDSRILDCWQLNNENEAWNVETSILVERTATKLAQTVRNLLRFSRYIRLIDCYYQGENRHNVFLRECISICQSEHPNRPILLEIHCWWRAQAAEDADRRRRSSESFFDYIAKKLEDAIPAAVELKLLLWTNHADGRDCDLMHDRFVSTEKGTIGIGSGLDEGKRNTTTNVNLLSKSAHDEIWKMFEHDSETFHCLHAKTISQNGIEAG